MNRITTALASTVITGGMLFAIPMSAEAGVRYTTITVTNVKDSCTGLILHNTDSDGKITGPRHVAEKGETIKFKVRNWRAVKGYSPKGTRLKSERRKNIITKKWETMHDYSKSRKNRDIPITWSLSGGATYRVTLKGC